jgi:hypothetical protein
LEVAHWKVAGAGEFLEDIVAKTIADLKSSRLCRVLRGGARLCGSLPRFLVAMPRNPYDS